jgi:serine/threonine protein kinase
MVMTGSTAAIVSQEDHQQLSCIRGSANRGLPLLFPACIAADVASGLTAVCCCGPLQVIHSDLKVRNVLLKSDGSSERGCIAKVADFGLAVKMDNQDTHVSAFQVSTQAECLQQPGG